MQKRIIVLLAAVLALATLRVDAQDAMFSQFYANPLYLNPAFAGTNVCPRVALNFRDQWPSMQGTFISSTASFDEHFDKIAGGVGLILFQDRAGENGGSINTYSISPMYSFKAKISKKFTMRLAVQADFQTKQLNWDNLVFGDMIDPRYGVVYQTGETHGNLSRWNFGLSAGLLGYTPHFYFGYAAHHIVTAAMDGEEGFSFINDNDANKMYDMNPVKHTLHVGAHFDLKRKSKIDHTFGDISISPNFIWQHQRPFNYFNTGLYLNFYPFTVGCWYRCAPMYTYDYYERVPDGTGQFEYDETTHNYIQGGNKNYEYRIEKIGLSDAFIVMFGLEYKWLKVAYSYDFTVGQLSNVATGGSHEVSLQLLLPCPEKHKAIKDLNCPSF